MECLPENLRSSLERKLRELNHLRPLPAPAVRKLQEHLRLEMTYNSNAIEGNSLTLKETFLVIHEGITVKGKPLKDHLEAKDHHAALEFLYECVEHDKKLTLSEHFIRTLHHMVVQDTEKEWAGKYRNSNVFIGGADHHPPEAFEVPSLMQGLMDWWKENRRNLHPIELAALFHHRLVHIHPFFDGNGRTARLAMNLLSMKAGYPLIIILKHDRKRYYRVLSEADKGRYEPLVRFIAQTTERSLDLYLKTLSSKKGRERFLPLGTFEKKFSYSGKYLNLLVRQGKLEAHKEGRNWVTSEEAIKRYLQGRKRHR